MVFYYYSIFFFLLCHICPLVVLLVTIANCTLVRAVVAKPRQWHTCFISPKIGTKLHLYMTIKKARLLVRKTYGGCKTQLLVILFWSYSSVYTGNSRIYRWRRTRSHLFLHGKFTTRRNVSGRKETNVLECLQTNSSTGFMEMGRRRTSRKNIGHNDPKMDASTRHFRFELITH